MAPKSPRQPGRTATDTDKERHIADETAPEPTPEQPATRPAVTETGLPVEDQIEKEWDPNKDGGLPTLFPAASPSTALPAGRGK